ncbi:MAG TPA: hypothetical protein P5295_16115 [Spirochaetota bacterium]|nr:hypothetical protein [Spirochaetota bacterium]
MYYDDEGKPKYRRLKEYSFSYIDFRPDTPNPLFIVCAPNIREALRLTPIGKPSDEYPEFITRYRKYRWEIKDITWVVPRLNLRKNEQPRIIFEHPGLKQSPIHPDRKRSKKG